VPTSYPPFGALAVIQSLQRAGYSPTLLDIDALRPLFEEVVERLRREQPDLVAISAVVSTAYGYVKRLGPAIRAACPSSRIVLGGNLAASAELLHRRCGIDVCVVGEGERVIVNLVKYFEAHPTVNDFEALNLIKGVTFLDAAGDVVFTGYEPALRADEFIDPDFEILEKSSKIERFVADPFDREDFRQDPRSHELHRAGKRMGTVVSTKGCVARCTFCHRWDRGYRVVPPAAVVRRIKHLIDRYNVGFVLFGDENFGSDRRATEELIRLIKPLDILWQVAGVRARTLDRSLLREMRDSGCTAVYCGFETGSPDILGVMEKNLKLADNQNAARAIFDAGLYTIYQFVLGMPGENFKTIRETIEMVKGVTEFLQRPPNEHLSVNYIQALPGTPVYEYARATGVIGNTADAEDEYLESISDVDAADDVKFLNFTQYPYLVVRTWRRWLYFDVTVHWYRQRRQREVSRRRGTTHRQGGYFNMQQVRSPALLSVLAPVKWLPIWARTLVREYQNSPRLLWTHMRELVVWLSRKQSGMRDTRSLRKVMNDMAPEPTTPSERNLMPLRQGR